ncbi:MAG: antitoxin Xre/MbcA/ParS toxin-binding domain-containing protein [Methylophilus sp.]|uniref:antitoxin Xre/MbcA/ParS toxin-binding domain-containing protein n=1 Tax=Methylophilus sp. TaxID=29541 RepID=UPI003F9F5253
MKRESISYNKACIYELAVSTFGSESKAHEWLHQYHLTLCMTPMTMCESTAGLVKVERILNAINYGGVV